MFGALKKLIKNMRKKSRNAYISTFNTNPNTSYDVGVPVSNSGFVQFTSNEYSKGEKNEDTREVKKPVEVVESIVIEQPVLDLNDLDKKIKVVRRRINVLTEQSCHLTDEREALGYLLARQKFKKYGAKFAWKVTTQEKINELLSKYKLMLVSFQGYAKNVPNEALDEIEQFAEAYGHITDEAPVLQLICDQGGPEQKKDPILLAKSPFGRWFYILGAWDKEVEYVDDLIYNGK